MKKETMSALIEAAADLGLELTPYEGYSGRGMRDRTTCGVTGRSIGDLLAAAVEAGHAMDDERSDELVCDLAKCSMDGMGMGFIVY